MLSVPASSCPARGEDIKPKLVLVKSQSTTTRTSARNASIGLVVIPALTSCQTLMMQHPRHVIELVSVPFFVCNPNPKNNSLEVKGRTVLESN